MAATAEATRLTEAHRQAQIALGAQVVAQMLAAWRLIRIDDLDRSAVQWLSVVVPLLTGQAARSASLAATYLTTFRTLELGVTAAGYRAPAHVPLVRARVQTSALVTGPASLRQALERGVPEQRALDVAAARTARAGSRLALDGGRALVQEAVAADRLALGFSRVTSGSACAFCATLASRGPAYKSEASGRFEAHDGCGCTVEPIYRRDGAETAQARAYAQEWRRATKGLSGDEALKAFRQVHEGRTVTLGPLATREDDTAA